MKLTNKQKRSVKRQVQIDQGVKTPVTRVFVSKKIYTRKKKHKKNIIMGAWIILILITMMIGSHLLDEYTN